MSGLEKNSSVLYRARIRKRKSVKKDKQKNVKFRLFD